MPKREHEAAPPEFTPTFVKATEADIDRLVDWDEAAAIASTGSGFEPEKRSLHADAYREALSAPRMEIVIVKTSADDRGSGAVVLEHHRGPEKFTEIVAGPFSGVGDEEGPASMSRDEFLALIENRDEAIDRTHMKSLALDQELRGKGIGRKVMAALRERLSAGGIDVLSFSTGRENIALRRLMKDAAFLEVRSLHGGYQDTKLIGLVDLRDE